jgi:hypothetical protein
MAETVDLNWCIVELLGHRVIAGFVSEVEIAGSGFLRVDLWAADGEPRATQYVAPSSIYCLTPTTEEAVRERMQPRPVYRYALPGPAQEQEEEEEEEDLWSPSPFDKTESVNPSVP